MPIRKSDKDKALSENLIKTAKRSIRYSISPYSKFKVGAAIATKTGKIYSGCNIENPSLMLSICAEKVALLSALSKGDRAFRAIAIVSNGDKYCYPCGSCRQMLWEFAKDIDVYLSCRKPKKTRRYSLRELLPHAFTP